MSDQQNMIEVEFTHPLTHILVGGQRVPFPKGSRTFLPAAEAHAARSRNNPVLEYAAVIDARKAADGIVAKAHQDAQAKVDRAIRRAMGENVPEPIDTDTVLLGTLSEKDALIESQAERIKTLDALVEDLEKQIATLQEQTSKGK